MPLSGVAAPGAAFFLQFAKNNAVGNEGDELGVRGLALGVGHGVAEDLHEGFPIAPVPGHLDGVADGPFHPGRRGLELFGHHRIQPLGDIVDERHIVDYGGDGFSEIGITLDMRRDTESGQNAGDSNLQIFLLRIISRITFRGGGWP